MVYYRMEHIDYSNADFETLVKKMKELIERVKTDEYWLTYGGKFPHYGDGHELIDAYLQKTDYFNIERKIHINSPVE